MGEKEKKRVREIKREKPIERKKGGKGRDIERGMRWGGGVKRE